MNDNIGNQQIPSSGLPATPCSGLHESPQDTEMLKELMAVEAERNAYKTERAEIMEQVENLGKYIGRPGMTAAHIISETVSIIEELQKEKAWLIEKGEKLVRWVEGPRHTHEEVRDHNGRLKDTGIWAQFYVAVRGIQRKDSNSPISGPNSPISGPNSPISCQNA